MKYTFEIWIDGNYYYEDEEYEEEIMLSDSEVAKIKELIQDYDDNLSNGLMPILQKGSEELYQKFYDAVFPHVFFELFQRDPCFEPEPGDENRCWDEYEDVEYLMETYGDGYDFDDAYIVRIPDEMMPSKPTLSKAMTKEELHSFIRKWHSDMKEDIMMKLCFGQDGLIIDEDNKLPEIIEKKILSTLEKAIAEYDEAILSQESFDPLDSVDTDSLANEIYEEFEKNGNTSDILPSL